MDHGLINVTLEASDADEEHPARGVYLVSLCKMPWPPAPACLVMNGGGDPS